MQSDTERALRNISILGSISQNDKLNTNDETFSIYVPTVLRGAVRLWYSEKRCSNIQKIQENVRLAITFIQNSSQEFSSLTSETYSSAARQNQCRRMFNSLEKSKKGLANLQQTYRDDTTMFTQLQIIMDEIDDFITISKTQPLFHFLMSQPSNSSCPSPVLKLESSSDN